jgi:dTDP-4-dehydrorhamnose reductase
MILVTGASGLLGANLLAVARDRGRAVVGAYRDCPIRVPGVPTRNVDVCRPEELRELVKSIRARWVVHCAAVTDVDWCEQNPDRTWEVNVRAAGDVARAASEAGAGVVYVSTDSVFDGRRGGYGEDDEPAPLNVYARSKLAGERAVAEQAAGAIILRTNLFGWNCRPKLSLAEWVLSRLEAGAPFPGFEDVIFAPVLLNDLAEIVLDLTDRGAAGLFHAAAADAASKYEFARLLADEFGHDPGLVRPARLADRPLAAPRPLNTVLRAEKLSRELGRPLPGLRDMVRRFKELRDGGYAARLKAFAEGSA